MPLGESSGEHPARTLCHPQSDQHRPAGGVRIVGAQGGGSGDFDRAVSAPELPGFEVALEYDGQAVVMFEIHQRHRCAATFAIVRAGDDVVPTDLAELQVRIRQVSDPNRHVIRSSTKGPCVCHRTAARMWSTRRCRTSGRGKPVRRATSPTSPIPIGCSRPCAAKGAHRRAVHQCRAGHMGEFVTRHRNGKTR